MAPLDAERSCRSECMKITSVIHKGLRRIIEDDVASGF
jgi:hypothetical protein